MRNLFTLLALSIAILPSLAMAAAKPPELIPILKSPQPVGEASLRKLLMHVYDVQFWSDSSDWKKAPYALTIIYDMDFTSDEMVDRTYDEMRHVSALPTDTLKRYAEKLRAIYPAVASGDRVTALQKTAQITAFYHNGKPIGEVNDSAFGPAFFAIWLSNQSSEPDMQKQLLHPHSNAEGL